MLLIPSIDLRAGHCVRLLRGDFDAETRYEFGPHELLLRYQRLGARWLHIVDLDGAREGTIANRGVIHQLAAQRAVLLQVGGGVRDGAAVDDLLDHGVARVVIGSAAIENPELVAPWLHAYGGERVCLALDVRVDRDGIPHPRIRGWQQESTLTLWDAVRRYAAEGLKHVLCTDVERDGALAGPNLSLYREARERFPNILWQASGGIRSGADLAALAALGVNAAISGKALIEQLIPIEDLRPFLPNA